jgi:hypothetical protein
MRFQPFTADADRILLGLDVAIIDTIRAVGWDLGQCASCTALFLRLRTDSKHCERCTPNRAVEYDKQHPDRARKRKRDHYLRKKGRPLEPADRRRGRKRLDD